MTLRVARGSSGGVIKSSVTGGLFMFGQPDSICETCFESGGEGVAVGFGPCGWFVR